MFADARGEWPTSAPGRRSLNRSLAILVAQIVILAGITVALSTPSPEVFWANLLVLTVAAGYVAAGVWAWTRRPTNPVGALIVAAGGALVVGNLSNSENVIVQVIGSSVSPLAFAVCVHLLLSYPGGRLIGWLPRLITVSSYASILILELAIFSIKAIEAVPDGAGAGAGTGTGTGTGATDLLQAVLGWSFLLIQVTLVVILCTRVVHARPPVRRLLAPMYVYGTLVMFIVPQLPIFGWPPLVLAIVQLLAMAGVPVMFVVSVVRGGFAQELANDVAGATLALDSTGQKELTLALVRLLGDPTARILRWSTSAGDPSAGELSALDGAPDNTVVCESSEQGQMFRSLDQHSAVFVIRQGTEILGAIIYSNRLVNDRDVLDVAGRLVGASILRIRLTERLVQSERELRNSRARVLAAADGARAQIARNLHDGVQMRLVFLSMNAGTLAGRLKERVPLGPPAGVLHDGGLPDGGLHDAATALRRDIDTTAAELRDLVHDVMPPLLTERGLGPALVALVDRAPLPTDVEIGAAVDDVSVLSEVKRALYFVAAESLTNIFKHSNASRISMSLTVHGGQTDHPLPSERELILDVVDDGVGFEWTSMTTRSPASPGPLDAHPIGVGVRGIIDRVEAVNGQVDFSSVVGGGTRVRVRVPCEL